MSMKSLRQSVSPVLPKIQLIYDEINAFRSQLFGGLNSRFQLLWFPVNQVHLNSWFTFVQHVVPGGREPPC